MRKTILYLFIAIIGNALGTAIMDQTNIAVHPMDVFLKDVQMKLRSIALGTYLSYFLGFLIGVVFGLLHRSIEGVGIGTLFTLVLSGLVMKYFNLYIRFLV